MAIYTVCNIVWFFLNSPLELTFWITYVITTRKENLFLNNNGANPTHYYNQPKIPAWQHEHDKPNPPT
jgi:hypothetical protein